MREMHKALKSARHRLREIVRFPGEHAAFLRQRVEKLRARGLRWRSGADEGPERASPQRAGVDIAGALAALRERLGLDRPGEGEWPWARSPWGRDSAPRRDEPAAFETPAVAARTAPDASSPHTPSLEAPAFDIPRRAPTRAPSRASWRDRFPSRARALRLAGLALLVVLAAPYAFIPIYRVVDPPFSALMARKWLTGTTIRHRWVDLEDISPALPAAVVIAEDATFCRHWGVDWNAVGEALAEAEDGERFRGASTIPMQTAKNLFLWSGGLTAVRKILEIPQAYAMSALWPKRRVIEVYLNIAEWGPGIFGAEAAAWHHFRKSAADLTPREAALLAAALPNPIRRNAGRPNGTTARIAARIGARVGREAHDAACVLSR